MPKLHEILAVEGDLRGTADTVIKEAIVTFDKRPNHFIQTDIATSHFADEDKKLDTEEHSAMETTVGEKLEYVGEMVTRYYDAYMTKEASNQSATATVMVDGKAFLEDVPVVVLLGMETKLGELRAMYGQIPTLRPGPVWERDTTDKQGVYRAKHPEKRFITRKTKKGVVMYPHSDKHPAQVQVLDEDISIAERITTTRSGMLSVLDKSLLLDRIDTLIQAFKKARQRANDTDLVERQMGKTVFAYLHDPLLTTSTT
jgi:hypothetical protein